MPHRLYNGDCLDVIPRLEPVATIFADPPDSIGLGYDEYDDNLSEAEYRCWMTRVLQECVRKAPIMWWSFNHKWIAMMGQILPHVLTDNWSVKFCVQTYTFGQNQNNDLGNGHRPLWRFRYKDAPLYPAQIKVPSWRQLNGDKRAAPGGRTPLDVFDFARVTGNSKQRRRHHPTQLHEGLVERCIKLTTKEGEPVLDPFGGTGTTLRVCKATNRQCTLIELSRNYCQHIAEEHGLTIDTIETTSTRTD